MIIFMWVLYLERVNVVIDKGPQIRYLFSCLYHNEWWIQSVMQSCLLLWNHFSIFVVDKLVLLGFIGKFLISLIVAKVVWFNYVQLYEPTGWLNSSNCLRLLRQIIPNLEVAYTVFISLGGGGVPFYKTCSLSSFNFIILYNILFYFYEVRQIQFGLSCL